VKMHIESTTIPGVYVGELDKHEDERGYFAQIYQNPSIMQIADTDYKQFNVFSSKARVLRGLHYQMKHPQGKFMMPLTGAIYHAVVDLRKNNFGRWFAKELLPYEFILSPECCMTGTLVTYGDSIVFEMVTQYWYPGESITVAWNDTDIGIRWPMEYPILKHEDANGKSFREVFSGKE